MVTESANSTHNKIFEEYPFYVNIYISNDLHTMPVKDIWFMCVMMLWKRII